MKQEIKELGVSYSLPEKVTVQQSLQYWGVFSTAIHNSQMMFLELWAVIVKLGLISDWDCAFFALDTPLEQVDDPRVAVLVMEVCNSVYRHMEGLKVLEKN
ncbi:MAG: hypothetical protein ACOX5F_01000 [Anaerovoracaceae bacterium]|jgi:hypothetical protein